MSLWEIITWPFAKLMVWLYELTGNYGVAVILFALVVNLVLTPFMAKSKKSMMHSTRLQPKIQELQRRHEGNQQKLNEEMQKLYREEGVNPMSGCLWSLIPFPILIALYSVIRQPITRMMFASQEVLSAIEGYFPDEIANLSARMQAYKEILLTDLVHNNWDAVNAALRSTEGWEKVLDIDFSFLGLNLGSQPQISTLWNGPYTWAALGLFLIPFISAGFSYLSMTVSQKTNPTAGGTEQAAAQMKTMNLMMPLMSVWFCFIMPAAMGIYWIANSVFGMVRDLILTGIYKKQLDKEDAERAASRSAREKELEEKRLETERLKAEGKTEVNANTSKKKQRASEKQKSDERKAALDRAERAARRERLGIQEQEKPASQVGNRRYARGRAYVPDRYEHPETAEEATEAAALASEGAEAIDESVADDVVVAAAAVEEAAEESVDVVEAAEESVNE